MLDASHQIRLLAMDGCEGDGQHGGEAEGCVDSDLLQASDLEAALHEPLLGPAEQPLNAPPLTEEFHQAACSPDHEVPPHPEGVSDPGVSPDGDDGLSAVVLRCLPDLP